MKIVAPAGNKERLYAAIKAGAEEIYMGLQGFGARRAAENFSVEEFIEALDYAHLRGSRIFLTLNTLMFQEEIEFLYLNLKKLYEHGLDAVIVQDLGLAYYLHQNFPDLELHGSTQLSVANHVEINFLQSIGFTRVVLPRELSFEEIKSIREHSSIELEVFVSGALCICYSGNCYLSSFLGGRSGNRGMCAQPCRKNYQINQKKKAYFLSPKDQLLEKEEIQKLKEIGIDSIKLEGRMKEANYVFATVQYYRNIIDNLSVEEKSSSLFNRGYSKGYFYQKTTEIMNPYFSSNLGERVGLIQGKEIHLEKEVILGDGFSYLSSSFEKLGGCYLNRIVVKGKQEKRKKAFKGEILILKELARGSKYLYRSYSKAIQDKIDFEKKQKEKRKEIIASFIGKIGKKAILSLQTDNERGKEIIVTISSEVKLETAKKKASTEEEIFQKIAELGNTSFVLKHADIDLEKNLFVPASLVKSLKRSAIEELEKKLLSSYLRISGPEWKLQSVLKEKIDTLEYYFIVRTKEQKKYLEEKGYSKILYRSYDIAREGELEKQSTNSLLAANLYQILKNQNSSGLLGNWNLNISNLYSFKCLECFPQLEILTLSPEMSFEKMKKIGVTKQKKAILAYSKLRGMYIELDLTQGKNTVLENQEKDTFQVMTNDLGHTEVYLEKALNILSKQDLIKELGISVVIIEFTYEDLKEMELVLQELREQTGRYQAYNYERGVY
ncbi:peptidase U32 family protein [Fusobacterium necrophorum]|uniref:peptidase U32 family protein n=1 Tax=Fusobacterium necrophorum TaxID=859 RepID=UPI003F9EDC6A